MKSVKSKSIEGRIKAPHSKSVFQRAVALSVLAPGLSSIDARSLCTDDIAALRAAKELGARVDIEDQRIFIKGGKRPGSCEIDCGESGLCFRMFSAIASLFDVEITLLATGTLAMRPMGMICGPLTALGALCKTTHGYPPVIVRGPVHGGKVEVDGSISSQFVTGLLIALPHCDQDSELVVTGLRSKPYVELTLSLLRRYGVRINADDDLEHLIIPGRQVYKPCEIEVEGDWSSASFMLVAGAIGGKASVRGLDPNSLQADRRILNALNDAGAKISVDDECVTAEKDALRAFNFDATDCPDLLPPLAVMALNCEGTSEIAGALRLMHKESDRARALTDVLRSIGGRVDVDQDIMRITKSALSGGRVDSHGDHRIAMTAAVAALIASGPVEILGDECVAKSYPDFFADLAALGAEVS